MRKIILTYGLIGGLVVALMMVITFGTGVVNWDNGEAIGYTTMIVALSVIYFGIKAYRDDDGQGRISFIKALVVGFWITLIASTIYVLTWLIVSNTLAIDFMSDYMDHAIDSMRSAGATEAEIESKVEEIRSFEKLYQNPLIKIAITYLEILPVGLIMTLISALILKTKQTD